MIISNIDDLPQFLQHSDGLIHDALAGAFLCVAVVAGPYLVAAELVGIAIRQIADPVVGQLGNVGVSKGGTVFNIQTQLGKKLPRHTDDRNIAYHQNLHPCLSLLSLQGR